ncbi:MAG: type II toxin-antitoxin system RelE/ParE family toxin [Desulfovibrionaceae bacterium]
MSKPQAGRVLWTFPALEELDEITAYYIARGELNVALTIIQRVFAAAEKVGEWPGMARKGRVAGTRELMIKGMPYIVIYREKKNGVSILRVLHTSRDDETFIQ